MKKFLCLAICMAAVLSLCSCGVQRQELVDMKSVEVDGKRCVVWEGRTYVPFCVVSKRDCGEQIGYLDGDRDDRISEYKGYSPDEWLVSWITTDGGALLLKEESITDVPNGLEAEY